jgi:hypothetical protein
MALAPFRMMKYPSLLGLRDEAIQNAAWIATALRASQ